MTKTPYKIFGYKGKQVRSNIHSHDLLNAFYEFYLNPKQGEVYNMDGGRQVNCSMLEAIEICEKITGNKLQYTYIDEARIGDHQWYITDNTKFKRDFPNWKVEYDIEKILQEIYSGNVKRWIV
jgi:CDP-paratose 2-epimerase